MDAQLTTILNIVTTVGAILSPIIVLVLSNRIERSRQVELSRLEKMRQLEEALRGERTSIYLKIIEPFILLLSHNLDLPNKREYQGKTSEQVGTAIIRSLEYREATYKLALMGSDEVVRAFNELLQFSYRNKGGISPEHAGTIMQLLGTALLAIRKSIGNEETALMPLQMLEMMITDIRQYQQQAAVSK